MPDRAIAWSRTEIAAAGTRRIPSGPGVTFARRRPGADSVPMMGTSRVWGTAAGIAPRLIHSATPRRSASSTADADSSRQRKSGSGPVRTRTSCSPILVRRSVSSGHSSVAGRPFTMSSVGPPCAVVVEPIIVEGRDARAAGGDLAGCGRGCPAGVHPPVESGDDDGRHQVGGVLDLEQDHVRKHRAPVGGCRIGAQDGSRHAILSTGASHPPRPDRPAERSPGLPCPGGRAWTLADRAAPSTGP